MGNRAEEDGGEEEGGGEGVEGGEVHWGRGGCIYGEVGGRERWTGAVDGKSRGRWLMWGLLFYNIVVFLVCGSVCGGVCIRCVVCGAIILLNGSFDEVVRFQK